MGKDTRSSAKGKRKSASATANDAIETYAQALRYLNDRVDFERVRPSRIPTHEFKLDRTRAILSALSDPQEGVRFVHVAGSKGKGSTCEMAASCLRAAGYTVGLFTSPHLTDVRERVRINGALIAQSDFARLMETIRNACESIAEEFGEPTYFELLTCLALLYFAEQAVDIAVLETGLGGRLDCTNVIAPEVTAVTHISLDHTTILGDTVEKIAREKGGIFKAGVPALTIAQETGVIEALTESADAAGSTLEVVGRDIDFSCRFEATSDRGPHMRVCLSTARSSYEHLPVPLMGEHQAMNCGLVLAILDRLSERGFSASEPQVLEGLDNVKANGRMEIVWDEPRVLLDGAHNPTSVKALVKAIGANLPYDSMVVIFGCAQDKDVDGMLAEIALGADKVIFTRSHDNPRAAEPVDLQHRFSKNHGKMSQVANSVDEAISTAGRAVSRGDLVCVTGSFYLVGEAKRAMNERRSKRNGKSHAARPTATARRKS